MYRKSYTVNVKHTYKGKHTQHEKTTGFQACFVHTKKSSKSVSYTDSNNPSPQINILYLLNEKKRSFPYPN